MLFHLFFKGEVMVAGRQGKQKLWDLSERFLPSWVSKKELSEQEIEYEAVQRSLRALGIATESELSWHFLRGRYRNLKETLKQLEAESKIQAVDITDGPVGKGQRYIHSQDIPLLGDLDSDTWEPRVSLLSPFDNLFCDRARTKLVFNFRLHHRNLHAPKQTQVWVLCPSHLVWRRIHRACGPAHGQEERKTAHQSSIR